MKFEVWRNENRANGHSQHLGYVEADSIAEAQQEAESQFECRDTCNLSVSEAPAPEDDETCNEPS